MLRTILVIAIVAASQPVYALSADDVVGEWMTPENKSKIEIYKCSNSYCGKIVWLKEPNYEVGHDKAGMAKVDDKNPDAALRTRPILGLELMHGFRFNGDDEWQDGKIYDPESGKTYSCKMSLKDNKTLKVRGYIGFSLLGRTSIWTR